MIIIKSFTGALLGELALGTGKQYAITTLYITK